MRKFIKICTIILIIILLLSCFTACGDDNSNEQNKREIKLTTDNYNDYLIMEGEVTGIPMPIDNNYYYKKYDGSFKSKSKKYEFVNVEIGIGFVYDATTPTVTCELSDDGVGNFSWTDSGFNFYPTGKANIYVVSVTGKVIINE